MSIDSRILMQGKKRERVRKINKKGEIEEERKSKNSKVNKEGRNYASFWKNMDGQ